MEKIRRAFRQFRSQDTPCRLSKPDDGVERLQSPDPQDPRLVWPPRLAHPPRVLGEIKEVSGRQYSRDLGHSIYLGGHVWYLFFDAIDMGLEGNLEGKVVTATSIALVPDEHDPTRCQYLESELVDNDTVREFVPLSKAELDFNCNEANKSKGIRIVNRPYGHFFYDRYTWTQAGWMFFEQFETRGRMLLKSNGLGLIRIEVAFSSTDIRCHRIGPFPLFGTYRLALGRIGSIADPDGWTYLLSNHGDQTAIARIQKLDGDYRELADMPNYQFLTKDGQWFSAGATHSVNTEALASNILVDQVEGLMVFLHDQGPPGKPYLWVGYARSRVDKLSAGVAARPAGPWELHELEESPKLSEDTETVQRSSIRLLEWACDPFQGRFLITWTENVNGRRTNTAAMFTLAMV